MQRSATACNIWSRSQKPIGTLLEEPRLDNFSRGWRDPNRDGKIDKASWPDKLDGDALKEQWRVKLEPSYSGPIVTADRVFVTETADRKFEVVRALDRKSGKQLWEAKWEGAMSVPFFAKSNGDWIRATPACDGERLFVAGVYLTMEVA